jgi:mRNA interferase RelE/StbE
MMYELIYTETALKHLKKLAPEAQRRIIAVLERARIRPHSYVKKLVGSSYFRLRAGKYRIILDIKSGQLKILVLEVAHRKSVYG